MKQVDLEFERYQFLDQLVSNSKFDIKAFTSIYPEYPFRINDSLICIPNHSGEIHSNEVETSAYYKVNAFGEVVDSLTLINDRIIAQGNYLINIKKIVFKRGNLKLLA